jgi:hypothetical protein
MVGFFIQCFAVFYFGFIEKGSVEPGGIGNGFFVVFVSLSDEFSFVLRLDC